MNSKIESIYWDCNCSILKFLKIPLHETLGSDWVMILIVLFWSQKMWRLFEELPQKIIRCLEFWNFHY
jgi:hypothetical protein